MAGVTRPSAAVIRFPGVNCEHETVRVLDEVGIDGHIVSSAETGADLDRFDAFFLPGGFSFEDRVRGGAIAAREPIMEFLSEAAPRGVPIMGICNGAQVLVESGLVPGDSSGTVEVALARNVMPGRSGYYSRWVTLEVTDAPCVFTTGVDVGTHVPMPTAHGEGRVATASTTRRESLLSGEGVALRYVTPDGRRADSFPHNPNGSLGGVAGLVNDAGNVLALMPHPERSAWLWQVPPHLPGEWGEARRAWRHRDDPGSVAVSVAGPGRVLFAALARYLGVSA